jgi:hypothetical protein
MNGNRAEYLVSVNADVPLLDVAFVDEHDPPGASAPRLTGPPERRREAVDIAPAAARR